MSVEKKILDEINRYKRINKYIAEQDVPAPPGVEPTSDEETPPTEVSPIPPTNAEPIDIESDPDVEKIGDEGNVEEPETGESDEVDVTELVTSQKDIASKQDQYFEQLFGQLSNLEQKLGEMDSLVQQLNSLEMKIEKMRPKTPEEKLELRSLDSGPFNQKLTDFFVDKKDEMEKTGKNEYVLTSDEIEDVNPDEIRKTFDSSSDEENEFRY